MSQFDAKFTMVAGKAMNFAYLFNAAFSGGLAGPIAYRIELMQPAGPSTAGGKQALQHIRLVPFDGQGPAIVMGSANPVEKTVELRTYKHLAELHSRRFRGAALPIDAEQYKLLIRRMQQFFGTQGLTVVMVETSNSMPPAALAAAPATVPMWILIVAIILATVAAVLLFIVLHTRHLL